MTDPTAARALAIQCVAELARGVTILDHEIAGAASRREALRTIANQRRILRTLTDMIHRDGRPTQ